MRKASSGANIILLLAIAAPCWATEVDLLGLFKDRAVLAIDGGKPRTLAVGGPAIHGVRLVSVAEDRADVEVDGQRRSLMLGGRNYAAAPPAGAGVSITADGAGQFFIEGTVNGAPVRFLVDTGATLVSLSARDAVRAGIDYRRGSQGVSETANGQARVWHVKLDKLGVGGIALTGVDALVHAGDMPFALLGMSFLNRMEMKRDGSTMTLRKRY